MLGMIREWINKYPVCTADEIISRIKFYDYISFDVFDTLIKRAVARPEIVFGIAAGQVIRSQKIGIAEETLVHARIEAEKEARRRINPEGEVTWDAICCCLNEKYPDIAPEYMEAELDVERRICHADPIIREVFNWCKEQRKKIVIISDMYLRKDSILELLALCGYSGFYAVFVSSDAGCRKATGRLYKTVLRELGISPDKIIHIGDSIKADCLTAKKCGIHAIHIARNPIRTKYIKIRGLDKAQRAKWVRMRSVMGGYIGSAWNDEYQYGFEIIGPLLYGFCMWLHQKAREQKVEKLFFLARDGYLIQKAYRSIFGYEAIENKYLYISREAVRKAQLWMRPDLHEMMSSFPVGRYMKIGELADYINVDRDIATGFWKACGLREEDFFLPETFLHDRRMLDFYERIRPLAVENAEDDYRKTIKYLYQEQFFGRIAVVDLGWRGTIQNCLQNILNVGGCRQTDLVGYYMGLDIRSVDLEHKFAFLPSEQAPNEFVSAFFEYPFLAPEGSLKGYASLPDGSVRPEMHRFEYNDAECAIVQRMQEGVLYFIECMRGQAAVEMLADPKFSYENMRRISKNPTLREAHRFGDLTFYEGEPRYLAAPRNILHYLFHPKDLPYDLSISGWRIGFLKRLFWISVDYNKLLKWYKRGHFRNEREGS